jgi:hypothetical protein
MPPTSPLMDNDDDRSRVPSGRLGNRGCSRSTTSTANTGDRQWSNLKSAPCNRAPHDNVSGTDCAHFHPKQEGEDRKE